MPHLNRECTVEQAAVNAALAGCRPEYFPVVLAAWEALGRERAVAGGGWQSTSGPAPLIVVNGPVRHRLGINCAGGVFGPGFRANATIARAIGLVVRNVFGIRPQELEQATQGVPGRWSLCIGENEEESPWEPLAVEVGLPAGTDAVSATLLRTCEFVDNRHTQDPEELLADFADTRLPDRSGDRPVLLGRAGARCRARADAGRPRVRQRPTCSSGSTSGAYAATRTWPAPARVSTGGPARASTSTGCTCCPPPNN